MTSDHSYMHEVPFVHKFDHEDLLIMAMTAGHFCLHNHGHRPQGLLDHDQAVLLLLGELLPPLQHPDLHRHLDDVPRRLLRVLLALRLQW